jgi:hypothetical protein
MRLATNGRCIVGLSSVPRADGTRSGSTEKLAPVQAIGSFFDEIIERSVDDEQ